MKQMTFPDVEQAGKRKRQVGTIEQAAQFGEVVLVAIPLEHYRSVPAK